MNYIIKIKELLMRFNEQMRALPDKVRSENPQWTKEAIIDKINQNKENLRRETKNKLEQMKVEIVFNKDKAIAELEKIRYPKLTANNDTFQNLLGEMEINNALHILSQNSLPVTMLNEIEKAIKQGRRDFASTLIDYMITNIADVHQKPEGIRVIKQIEELENKDENYSKHKAIINEASDAYEIVQEFLTTLAGNPDTIQIGKLWKHMNDEEIKMVVDYR